MGRWHGVYARLMIMDFLKEIVERTKGISEGWGIVFEDEDGSVKCTEPMETVSMNLFGFTPDFFQHIEETVSRYF